MQETEAILLIIFLYGWAKNKSSYNIKVGQKTKANIIPNIPLKIIFIVTILS